MSRRNVLLLIAATAVCYACYVRAEQNPYARYVAAGYSVIDRWALEEVPDQELFDGAMRGMVGVLHRRGDQHSDFVEAKSREVFRQEITQEFGGVGIHMRISGTPSYPRVVGPPEPNSPAFGSNIRSGDSILAVDGHSTADLTLNEIVRIVRGPIGESVVLTVRHEGESDTQEIALVRAKITVASILGDKLIGPGVWRFQLETNSNIGYVRIIKFGDKTHEELRRILARLAKQEIQGLILDLRDNHGGSLDAAVDVCQMFLPTGVTIVSTRDRHQRLRDRRVAERPGEYQQLPLVVIINRNSASASEIVAACLQDYDRALVIGERSYGKGTVQHVIRLESGRSLLKLTSESFWRPNGKQIHRASGASENEQWGVRPDRPWEVPQSKVDYALWKLYRSRRDLRDDANDDDANDDDFVEKLGLKPTDVPKQLIDPTLKKAVEALKTLTMSE